MADSARFDLRELADIARDRTAQGRARLFALLAALLCDRWSQLTARERDMLAELLVVLVPRADPADRERLGRHLATRPAIPSILQPLVILPPAGVSKPGKTGPTITINAPILATTRLRPVRASRPRPRLTINPLKITLRGERQPSTAAQAQPVPQAEIRTGPPVILPASPQQATGAPSLEPSATRAERTEAGAMLVPPIDSALAETPSIELPPPVAASAASAPARSKPGVERPDQGQTPTIMTSSVRAEPNSPLDDMLAAPRANPHRVTAELLSEVLAQDDLPRFEVMLAHLCKLRAPLLRRLLRDGGSESFAILGRAAGLDASQFETQWQDWRRQMSELDRLIGPPDRRDARRIGAFFAALTDKQVDRLIQRWRSDGARLFSETGR